MAFDLTAVFQLRDRGTSQLRNIMRTMDRMERSTRSVTQATQQTQSSMSRLSRANSIASSAISGTQRAASGMASSISGATRAIGSQAKQLGGLQSQLVGIAGAYIGVQTASKAFSATIGAAASYEQQEIVTKTMFKDDGKAKEYMAMMEKMALDSAVLNSNDMMVGSKAFVGLTKDLGQLEKIWNVTEKLQAFSGADTQQASFSWKELLQGDAVSIVEAIGIDKKEAQKIAKMDGVDAKISAMTKLLDTMGVTDQTLEEMANTTLGQWSAITEKAGVFARLIGKAPNTKLGAVLADINKAFEKINTEDFAKKVGDKIGEVLDVAVNVGKQLWKWKEPIAYLGGAIAAALGAFAVIGTISLLINPVSLIAAGIAGAAVGMVALYNNSETFRNAISGVVGKAKELWNAFQSGGTGGLLDAMFGKGTADTVKAKIDEVVAMASGIYEKLKPGIDKTQEAFAGAWSTVSDIFSNAWSIIQPILSGLSSLMQIIGGVAVVAFNNIILPALQFIAGAFSSLWTIAQPILTLLAGLFDVLASVALALWNNAIGPLVGFLSTAIKNTFTAFGDVLSTIAGWFEKLNGWANTAKDTLGKFADKVAGIKLPDWVTNGITTVVNTVGKVIGAKPDGSHKTGLWSVPWDGYMAELHRSEIVLPAAEANAYRSFVGKGGSLNDVRGLDDISYKEASAGITKNSTTNYYHETSSGNAQPTRNTPVELTVNFNGDNIIQGDIDHEKIAYKIAREVEKVVAFK